MAKSYVIEVINHSSQNHQQLELFAA
jgi:hypothetical protein